MSKKVYNGNDIDVAQIAAGLGIVCSLYGVVAPQPRGVFGLLILFSGIILYLLRQSEWLDAEK